MKDRNRLNIKHLVLISAFAVLFFSTCSSYKEVRSYYRQDIPEIDAMFRDWKQDFKFDEKNNLYFLVSNDEDNLYFAMKTQNIDLQRKIMMFGMKVWIDNTGDHKKKMAVHYPLPDRNKKPPAQTGDNRVPQKIEDYSYRQDKRLNQIELLGFGNEREIINKLSNPSINAEIKTVGSNYLAYELKIPLDELSVKPDTTHPISIGIETGYLEDRNRQPENYNRSRGNRGGIYGGNYGRYNQMSSYSSHRRVSEMMTPTKLWLKQVYLSKH